MKNTRTLSLKGHFIALFFLIAFGCNKDNLNQSQLISQNVESEEMATHTQEAIQWFGRNIPTISNKVKSAGPNDKPHPMTLFSKKANWSKAFSYKKGNTIITEGYLDWDNGMPVLINPSQHLGKGIGDLYEGDKRYLSPDIKLLIVDVNGNKHSEIMYLLPELNYLNSKANHSKKDNSYFEVDKKYSGEIYFYDFDGNYLRGYGFIDGKQNSFIGIQQASKPTGGFRYMSCSWQSVPVVTWYQTVYYDPYYGYTVQATQVITYTYNYVCTDTGGGSSIPTYPGGSGGGSSSFSSTDLQIDDDDEQINSSEWWLIAQYPPAALKIKANREKAFGMTSKYFGFNGTNDCSDAFRHAFFNAINTRDVTRFIAEQFSDAHEASTPAGEQLAKEMDIWNNTIGHNIGKSYPTATDDQIALKVLSFMSIGAMKVFTNPQDYSGTLKSSSGCKSVFE